MDRQDRIVIAIQIVFFIWMIAVAGLSLRKIESRRQSYDKCRGTAQGCGQIEKAIEEASRDKSK